MRLIDVAAILDVETSIKEGKEFSASTPVLEEFYGPDLAEKKYAILSHCWGVEKQGEKEVSYKEMKKRLQEDSRHLQTSTERRLKVGVDRHLLH